MLGSSVRHRSTSEQRTPILRQYPETINLQAMPMNDLPTPCPCKASPASPGGRHRVVCPSMPRKTEHSMLLMPCGEELPIPRAVLPRSGSGSCLFDLVIDFYGNLYKLPLNPRMRTSESSKPRTLHKGHPSIDLHHKPEDPAGLCTRIPSGYQRPRARSSPSCNSKPPEPHMGQVILP